MLENQQVLQERYLLRERLGQNAGRETWLALDQQTRSLVVVKLLTFSDRLEWDQLRLFEREAQVLKHLDHPCIPRYQDFFCVSDRLLWFALIQNYVPGVSLKQLLEQGRRFQEPEVRRIAHQILDILIYLHGLSPPVLHRDIKPSNLMLVDGDTYLIDFGAVQDRAAKAGATFTVVGTYGYAPLEQLGGRATAASDLYALGATLIHLLTGVAPANLPQENGQIQFTKGLHLNPGFVRWLWRLTQVNVELRFASAEAAKQALTDNEAATRGIVVAQPKYSRIQLKKSPKQLEVLIKNAIPTWAKVFAVGSVVYAAGTILVLATMLLQSISGLFAFFSWSFFYPIILLILGAIPIIVLLAMYDRKINFLKIIGRHHTTLRLNSQRYEIDWHWLGIRKHREGPITEIERVAKAESEKTPAVSLTVGVSEYLITTLDPPMTEAERDWLLEEIRQWLALE